MDLKNKFCPRPFEYLEVNYKRDQKIPCYACCPSTLPVEIGDMAIDDPSQIWNSKEIKNIRKSILEGSFSYCDKQLCPEIQEEKLQDKNYLFNDFYKDIVSKNLLELESPKVLNFSNDRSCNLSCPSCRTNTIMLSSGSDFEQMAAIHQRIEKELFPGLEKIILCSSGDPFASKLYRKLLLEMDGDRYPQLKIQIVTNGLLFTEDMWNQMEKIQKNISSVYVSIDAATPQVYEIVRRGGQLRDLIPNLEFLAKLRKEKKIDLLQFDFVVQNKNFRDMPDFVRLGEKIGADHVFFQRIINWGTFSEEEFLDHAIWMTDHPDHGEFLSMLKSPALKSPLVKQGNLSEFMEDSAGKKIRKLLAKIKPLRHAYIRAKQFFFEQYR